MTEAAPTAATGFQPNRRQMKLEPWQDPSEEPYVRIAGVTKKFGDFTAVDDVSVSIYRGELFSLLGGSGCGKTTLLRMLAGFERPTSGHIYIDGVDMSEIPPYDRPVNMMFQSYALFPHMSVEQNVAFGLRQDRLPSAEIRHRVGEALELVKLAPQRRRKPHQLSGGQRQRVALARSLVKRPKLLLLDEPLAALDRKLREETQFELVNIQEQVGITFVMVTHDQEEAMAMSTRIAVMDAGWIVQVGTPAEIYEYPQTRFVAEFIGQVNLFEGLVIEDATDHVVIDCEAANAKLMVSHAAPVPVGTRVNVAVRPEKMSIAKEPPDDRRNCVQGIVDEIAYLGNFSTYLIRLPNAMTVRVTAPNMTRMTELPITWEDQVHVSWPAFAGVILPV